MQYSLAPRQKSPGRSLSVIAAARLVRIYSGEFGIIALPFDLKEKIQKIPTGAKTFIRRGKKLSGGWQKVLQNGAGIDKLYTKKSNC